MEWVVRVLRKDVVMGGDWDEGEHGDGEDGVRGYEGMGEWAEGQCQGRRRHQEEEEDKVRYYYNKDNMQVGCMVHCKDNSCVEGMHYRMGGLGYCCPHFVGVLEDQ